LLCFGIHCNDVDVMLGACLQRSDSLLAGDEIATTTAMMTITNDDDGGEMMTMIVIDEVLY